MKWSLQLPTMIDGSMMMNQSHRQEMKTPCLETPKRKNVLILSQMHRKMLKNLIDRQLKIMFESASEESDQKLAFREQTSKSASIDS